MDILSASTGGPPVAPDADPTPSPAQVEQTAVEALYAADTPAPAPEPAPEPQTQPEPALESHDGTEPTADDLPDAEPEPEPPAIAAPSSWKAKEKDAFAQLPREIQETVTRREAEREKFVAQKANEATRARQEVEAQARAEVLRIHEQAEQGLTAFLGGPQPRRPDPALLRGTEEDRADYYAQLGEFEDQAAQRDQAQRTLAYHRQQREAQEQTLFARDAEEQRTILQEKFPEYLDPERLPDLSRELSAIGTTLGYPSELLQEARAQDIIALRTASEWKAKADKYDSIQREKMARVREAKKLAPVARPGTSGAAPKPAADPLAVLYPND